MRKSASRISIGLAFAFALALNLLSSLPATVGAQDMMEDSVFASIRVYDGVDPADQAEIARLTAEGFLPIMRESEGFVGYYLLPAEDMLAAISLFDSAEQASASNDAAREFVAENLAPLLPNAPMTVEGTVEVSAQLSADTFDETMTTEGMAMPLYALLAIYDGFDMARLDETVTLVESVFLPDLRESGGLFSYYGISDGVDKAVALRIMDSEESLQRGSGIAADFVAERLADWLPDNPLQVSGSLAVAALAHVHTGANLVDGMMSDDSLFASVRVYAGVDPADQAEIARQTAEGFLPIMRESEGFAGYYLLLAGDMLAAISLFSSAEQVSASNDAAREFVTENLAPLLPNAPMIVEGTVEVSTQPFADNVDETMTTEDMAMPLHALLAIYDGFDMARLDETVTLVESVLLPDLRESGGLFSYYGISDGVDKAVALRIVDSAESLQRGSEIGAGFVAERLGDWLPDNPLQVSGPLGVAALAEINMDENLVAR